MNRMLRNQNGFTLFELVIVIAILAIITGIAVPLLVPTLRVKETEATKEEMQNLESALLRYYKDTGQFSDDTGNDTTDLAQLESNTYGVTGWNGPYMTSGVEGSKDYARDAWGTNYQYTYVAGADSCQLTSYGPDRVSGGGDDITITISGAIIDRDEEIEKIDETQLELMMLKPAIALYNYDVKTLPPQPHHVYPTILNDLIIKPSGVSGWAGPYTTQYYYQSDAWGRAYDYSSSTGWVYSWGPNGINESANGVIGGDDIG